MRVLLVVLLICNTYAAEPVITIENACVAPDTQDKCTEYVSEDKGGPNCTVCCIGGDVRLIKCDEAKK